MVFTIELWYIILFSFVHCVLIALLAYTVPAWPLRHKLSPILRCRKIRKVSKNRKAIFVLKKTGIATKIC